MYLQSENLCRIRIELHVLDGVHIDLGNKRRNELLYKTNRNHVRVFVVLRVHSCRRRVTVRLKHRTRRTKYSFRNRRNYFLYYI